MITVKTVKSIKKVAGMTSHGLSPGFLSFYKIFPMKLIALPSPARYANKVPVVKREGLN